MFVHASILFYIKRSKLLKNGEAPLYLRITVEGVSAECGLKKSVPPKLWDPDKHRMKGSSVQAKEVNESVLITQMKLFNLRKELQEKGHTITAKLLLDVFKGKKLKQDPTLIEVFEDHNDRMFQLVGQEYSHSTYGRYKTSLGHIHLFMKEKYGHCEVRLQELDLSFIKDFEHYLKTKVNCQHNSAMKHIKSLKKVVKHAREIGMLNQDPFVAYKTRTQLTKRTVLDEAELTRIEELDLGNTRLEQVRDLFIFQCYTGLSYIELKTLNQKSIREDKKGKKWIHGHRTKSKIEFQVPLLKRAQDILNKYSSAPGVDLLPVRSNQKTNEYLKEIATLARIEKRLSTHVARHTFATTVMLANGIPMHVIMQMLGHTKLQTTQLYSKVDVDMIAKAMKDLLS